MEGTAAAPFRVPDDASGAPVLAGPWRWVLAYGSNASPDRLCDKELDARGGLLLPASVVGWRPAWEARRTTSTGAVPLTLHPAPGHRLDTFVLGISPLDAARLDASEGRGRNYLLGHAGPASVAARFGLDDVLAYGATRTTRLLVTDGAVATYPETDQGVASRLVDDASASVTVPAEPLTAPPSSWPETPLRDLPLFVYGTLQPGMARWRSISELVEVVGRGATDGEIVGTVFGWPAASFGGGAHIQGTLLRPVSAGAAVELYRVCDRIEDVPSLFRRVAVRVTVGYDVTWAASYEWNHDRGEAPGTRLDDGVWLP